MPKKVPKKTELFGTDVEPIAFQPSKTACVHSNYNAKQRF